MIYQACEKKDRFHYRIKGQTRPFIDENLQFRFPGIESPKDQMIESPTSHQIHAYYSHLYDITYESDPLEIELIQAMSETQQAYETWKQIQQKIYQREEFKRLFIN
jgi:hypothetical protein